MSKSIYNFQGEIGKLNLGATHYNGENALFLADCAKLAYQPKESIKHVMQKQLNFNNFRFFDVGKSTQAFIAGNDKMIIVAFRGTQEIRDFFKDAKLKLENDVVGEVHRGFRTSLNEVWDNNIKDQDMRLFIKKCRDNNQSIWFCGHSLGAALATLAAAEYVLGGNELDADAVKGIYTIGQPRVGNRAFAKGFDAVLADKCFRIVNNNDVVAKMPLPGIFLKYTHVGQEFYIDSEGRLQGSISLWKKLLDQFRGVKNDFGDIGIDALEDHGSEGYVKLIKDNRSVTF